MKTLYTIAFALIALHTFAQDSWIQKANAPMGARLGGVAFSIGDYGYYFSGSLTGTFYDDLWAYDPATNTWTQKASCPGGAKNHPTAFVINDKAYVCTGGTSTGSATSEVWEYDATLNAWTQKNDFPGGARSNLFGFSIGNKGYIGAGNASSVYFHDFWEYDATADTWTQKADYPAGDAYYFGGTFTIDNIGYVAGHKPPGGSSNAPVADLWAYDATTNQWIQKADMPSAAMFAGVFAINDRGYVVAGRTNIGAAGTPLNTTMEYDPATDAWTQRAAFPGAARWGNRGFVLNGKGYTVMGSESGTYYDDLYEYTATADTTQDTTTTSISILPTRDALNVYPNPASNHITINTTSHQPVFIYDAFGREVKVINAKKKKHTIDVTDLPVGVYLLQNVTGEAKRFVIQR